MASTTSPLRSGHGAVVSPLPGAGAKKAGHLIHARRAPVNTTIVDATRQGERPLPVQSLSPVYTFAGHAGLLIGGFTLVAMLMGGLPYLTGGL